ncbi:NaeI family type II restriction endonuclease [Streptomyces sp. NPDC015346]|uniref:NaeI family type II restriction endonuclease n=1 Tax=Streptomyces sp. NPDC015346 TaxID=3364954 RepID=UPI0036F756A1
MFLRDLRDAAGLSVEQLHLLLPDMVGNAAKPAVSTLHRRLRGVGLRNHRGLVDAVVNVCVTDPAEASKAVNRARSLLREAWSRPVPDGSGSGVGGDCTAHLAKLVKVQEQLLELTAALGRVKQAKEQAEARLDARVNSRDEELAELNRRLLVVTGERDEARHSAREAAQRIASLERLLAALRPSPARARPAEPKQERDKEQPRGEEESLSGERDVAAVREELQRLDPYGRRMAAVLEQATERLLDGAHTGRYRWEDLTKSEKTMTGQLVENLMRHDFQFDSSPRLDFRIAGVDVDLKVTTGTNWMIPREAQGSVCVLVRLDHRRGSWSLGVVRATEQVVADVGNRDGKRTLSAAGREAIAWIHRDVPLPVNILDRLPADEVSAILAEETGQRRVNELFRVAQRQPVTRTVVATVARQQDAAKRVRGARGTLAAEGIVILGHQAAHPEIARALGLPVPEKGSWVSARLASVTEEEEGSSRWVLLSGERWRLATPDDEPGHLPAY